MVEFLLPSNDEVCLRALQRHTILQMHQDLKTFLHECSGHQFHFHNYLNKFMSVTTSLVCVAEMAKAFICSMTLIIPAYQLVIFEFSLFLVTD